VRSILFGGAARRWSLSVGLLAGLATLIVSLAATTNAQDNPRPPHWFWGDDMDSYVGDQVVAINQNGVQVESSNIDSSGGWYLTVSPEDARTVTLRLVTDSGNRETDPLDVMEAGFDAEGLSISDFSNRVTDEIEATGDTLPVRIIARLHPTRATRTLEFNLRVNGVDIDPPPSARYLGPSLRTNRWLFSSPIDAGNGYEVRIIACKQDDDDVIFGLRVEGFDDIIPRLRRLGSSIVDNRWRQSTEIEIPQPGDSLNVSRLRDDPGCTGGSLAP
jgi:hypothetical protein